MAKNSSVLSTTIVSWIHKLSLSVFLVGCLGNPGWAATKTVEIIGNPAVNEDRVTLRIRIQDDVGRPVVGLNETQFSLLVDGKDVKFRDKDWKSPNEAVPPPAYIVLLLDMSGSMTAPDSRGTTKIKGAIAAIEKLKETLARRSKGAPSSRKPKLAIVPFGDPGEKCAQGFPVEPESFKFFTADDFKLQNHLEYLKGLTPCASTNIYDPLTTTIKLLGNEDDARFYPPEQSGQPKPRLSVVLLSDGFHNKAKEAEDFKTLSSLLRRNRQIIVHTLGYGLTATELGQRFELGRPAERRDIWGGDAAKTPKGKVPSEEFVDELRLKQIAEPSGGIAEFSGNAQAIAEKLELFLNALLGEYEITYEEPNPERGSKHDVKVLVTDDSGTKTESGPKGYTITVFGRCLPLLTRAGFFGFTVLLISIGGIAPFWAWSQSLKQEG